MIEVLQPGFETCVQDFPGRIGYWAQGLPPSGPMDSWSFRLANLLVGNPPSAAGFECQFVGPTVKFHVDTVIAICGADMQPMLDDKPLPIWESVGLRAGHTLRLSFVKVGARAYLAVAGGIDTPEWLGSRSTFNKAGVGGMEGHALRAGQMIPVGKARGTPGLRVKDDCRPPFSANRKWIIEVVRGPNDDWIDDAGHERFLNNDWVLLAKSDRTGFRLKGPEWTFTEKAYSKAPEHGSDPSNIIDQGYPLGSINLTGQTPIILVNDGPSMGGFICPYTIPSAVFWKLGQSKPGDIYRFKCISVEEAQELRRYVDRLCSEASIT